MQRTGRRKKIRIRRRDWVGDAVLVLVCGVVLLVCLRLPWVNPDGRGFVNFSFFQGEGLNGILQTRWGWPAAVVAVVTFAAGLAMLLTRPRRASALLGVLVAVCGLAAFGVAQDAAGSAGWYDPGLGMYLTTLVGVLLVPIGLAAALVAWILVRAEPAGAEPPVPALAATAGPGAPVTPDGPPPAPPARGSGPQS